MPPLSNSRNGRPEAAGPDARFAGEGDQRQTPALQLQVGRSLRMHPLLAASVAAAVFVLMVAFAFLRKPVYQAEALIYIEPFEVRVLPDGSAGGYDPSRYDSYLQQQTQTVKRPDTLEAALRKLPLGMWSSPGESPAVGAKRLQGALSVDRVLNSYELGIDVTAGNGAAAAAAANAVAEAYLEIGRKDEHARADQRLQLLTEERQRINDDMTRDKAEEAQLGGALGVARPGGDGGNPYDTQTAGLRQQLDVAREAHDAVSAQLSSISGAAGNGLATAADELILTDPGLVSIKQTLSQRRAVLSDQMAGLTPANPIYKQDGEEIAAIDRSIDRAAADARLRAERQLEDKLRLDMRRTADVEARLNAQLAEETARATGAGPKLQRASELETDLQRLTARYATVDDAIRGLQLETGGPGQAHLALAASAPDAPQPSKRKLLLLLALPLALLCGMAAAVLARKRDKRLYLGSDMEEVLGFAPMAVLPREGEVSTGAYDEFLLRLAGALEGAYRHEGVRSVVFTPVTAERGNSTLLTRLCAKLQQIGSLAECIRAEDLMPSSGNGSAARDAAATTQLERLLGMHDIVLVQAPPLLGSALAEYAVRCADMTVLLVESGSTNRDDLRRATALLQRLHPRSIGAVLEDLPLAMADAVFRNAARVVDRPVAPQSVPKQEIVAAPVQVVEAVMPHTLAPASTVDAARHPLVVEEAAFEPQASPTITEIVPEISAPERREPEQSAAALLDKADKPQSASAEDLWDWQTPQMPATRPPLPEAWHVVTEQDETLRFREARVEERPAGTVESNGDVSLSFDETRVGQRSEGWRSWTATEEQTAADEMTSSISQALRQVDPAADSVDKTLQPKAATEEQRERRPLERSGPTQPQKSEDSRTSNRFGFFAHMRSFFGFVDEPKFQIVPDEYRNDSGSTEPEQVNEASDVPEVFARDEDQLSQLPSASDIRVVTEQQDDDPPPSLNSETVILPEVPAISALVAFPETSVKDVFSPAHGDDGGNEDSETSEPLDIVPVPVAAPAHEPAVLPMNRTVLPTIVGPVPESRGELPDVTLPRKRAVAPLTVAAIPSVVTSVGAERSPASPPHHAESKLPAPSDAGTFPRTLVEEQKGTATATASPRRGLEKAAAYTFHEEGPPARASEGISALRSGAGLRKAVVRQEAALRSGQAAVTAPPMPARERAGSGRRWAMLSRFGQDGNGNASQAPVPADDERKPHV